MVIMVIMTLMATMTLMAQGAMQDFILHFTTWLMLQSCFPVNNKMQTGFTPILIPDKNTPELRNNLNPTSKKFNFSRFVTFYFPTKKPWKNGRKTIHHEPVQEKDREI